MTGVQTCALPIDARGLGQGQQLLHKSVVYVFLQQQTRTRNAGLPCSRKNTRYRPVYGVLDIGVGEHDIGRFPTQLQADVLEVLSSCNIDGLAGSVRPGE